MVEILKESDVKISAELLSELKEQVHEQGQVIIHFLYDGGLAADFGFIRIWETSYLYDKHTSHVSNLIHAERISLAPIWTPVLPGSKHYFTLIFSGLPKDCVLFDFKEECDSDGPAFEVRGIKRNKTDVYYCLIS
jgi:hypothetical protein